MLNTKFCLIREFDNLELFRAKAIHYNYARHSHPGYSIGVIESGVGGNYYRGSTYLAPPKSIVLMNPESVHTGYSAEGLPLTYRMFYLSIELVRQIAKESKITGTPYFKDAVVQNKVLAEKIFSLHAILERCPRLASQSPDSLEKQSLLLEVFSAILYHYANVAVPSVRLGKEHQAVHLIKEYLHDNFSDRISLEELVQITNLNRFYLIRVFRQATGMPPYTYLNQIRMRKAKQFLRQGMSISNTAIALIASS